MARDYEIKPAFLQAITPDKLGRQIVTTSTFQAQLEAVNHNWTLQQCNHLIRREQNMLMELATENTTVVITQNGKTLDGNGLEKTEALGKVTAKVLALYERPTI